MVVESKWVSGASPCKVFGVCHAEMACFGGFLGFLGGFNLMDRLECG